ncbi:beta family protein [Thioalkalivibrio nitratireducens]|uniref:beta family protein n=1 Tax=Thioalkalivibrio nitratireducens TaxID=186931 RepID=UPI0002F68195|nr:beta family protein [Thioalkalivibrio nitratireducens]
MRPTYIPILKAKKGEFDALSHLHSTHAERIQPLFELPKLGHSVRRAKRFENSTAITEAYLDEVAQHVARVRKGMPVFLDMFHWAPNARTEGGEHVLSYASNALESLGVAVSPVIGYDRWDDLEYQQALRQMRPTQGRYYCLRLDSSAIEEDFLDPPFFEGRLVEIMTTIGISASECAVLVDFGDVTGKPIPHLQDGLERALELLFSKGFMYFALAGCSLPPVINQIVKDQDSERMVLRRELVAWRSIRTIHPSVPLVFGDYGVRGPNSNDEVIAPHRNGKIRYTTDQHYFVARGHSMQQRDKGKQYHRLAAIVATSGYYCGERFSWGDGELLRCSLGEFPGNATTWIGIDTNHHIVSVLSEILEFERQLVPATNALANS